MLDFIKRIPIGLVVKLAVFAGISIAIYSSYSYKKSMSGMEVDVNEMVVEMKIFEKEHEVILEQLKDLNVTKIDVTTGSIHTIKF